jgi:hypothetical protein
MTPAWLGHEQTVRTRLGELGAPQLPFVDGHRVEVEGDRRVDDVGVVDLGQPREVVGEHRAERHGRR